MSTILITGANRGLGYEHARGYIARGDTVIACCRNPDTATQLIALGETAGGRLRIEALNVLDPDDVARLAAKLKGQPIDILINNAGMFGRRGVPEGMAEQSLEGMDYDMWADMFALNVMAPFRMVSSLVDLIAASDRKVVVMMSSDMGSIAASKQGGAHAYRSSKAALNMLTKSLANDLAPRGVTIISMAPGWTRTDMGGAGGQWDVEESVRLQQKVIDGLGAADTGRFINLLNETVPW